MMYVAGMETLVQQEALAASGMHCPTDRTQILLKLRAEPIPSSWLNNRSSDDCVNHLACLLGCGLLYGPVGSTCPHRLAIAHRHA